MITYSYDREGAVSYAKKWAYDRNQKFYDFERYSLGGDCTNFVSQCLLYGGCVMNYQRYGWYYINLNNRAPAWTGVEPLHTFLTGNKGIGPFGYEIDLFESEIGDIVQFSFDGRIFSHSCIITGYSGNDINTATTLLTTHSSDSYNRPFNTYPYKMFRCIHISGARR